VANTLGCNSIGYRFASRCLRFIISNQTFSDTEGLKMVCVTLRELTMTCNFSGDKHSSDSFMTFCTLIYIYIYIYVTDAKLQITKLARWAAIINTRQSSCTHTHTLAHTLVGGYLAG